MPLLKPLNRTLMPFVKLIGSESLFNVYRRLWIRLGRYQEAKTQYGGSFVCDLRDRVPAFIYYFGFWEPNITAWIGKRLAPGDVFVDVGANIGYYTVLASQRVGQTGAVVAIDASPSIYEKLIGSIAANQCGNVRAVNVAVSERPGVVTVYAGPPGNTGSTSLLPQWRDGRPEADVPSYPLTQILTSVELSRVRLIKIDVEGAELPVLRQLISTLHQYPANTEILVECSSGGDTNDWDNIFSIFISKGFVAYAIENAYTVAWYLRWRRVSPPRPISALPEGQTDVLFTRDRNAAEL